jgi:hypothetical protein
MARTPRAALGLVCVPMLAACKPELQVTEHGISLGPVEARDLKSGAVLVGATLAAAGVQHAAERAQERRLPRHRAIPWNSTEGILLRNGIQPPFPLPEPRP